MRKRALSVRWLGWLSDIRRMLDGQKSCRAGLPIAYVSGATALARWYVHEGEGRGVQFFIRHSMGISEHQILWKTRPKFSCVPLGHKWMWWPG
jgi:hypothetical protein